MLPIECQIAHLARLMFYSPEWFSKSYRAPNLLKLLPFLSIYFLKDSLSIREAAKSVSF